MRVVFFVTVFFLMMPVFLFGQNLVPNYEFDLGHDGAEPYGIDNDENINLWLLNWDRALSAGCLMCIQPVFKTCPTPDWVDASSIGSDIYPIIPDNRWIHARWADVYYGQEGMRVQLTEELVAGGTYTITYWTVNRMALEVHDLRVYLSNWGERWDSQPFWALGRNRILVDYFGQPIIPFVEDVTPSPFQPMASHWHQRRVEFTVPNDMDDLEHLVLISRHITHEFDGVVLKQGGCNDPLVIDNTSFRPGVHHPYFGTPIQIGFNGPVNTEGATLTFVSPDEIQINEIYVPGYEAFHVYNAPCECESPIVNVGTPPILCSSTPAQLGSPAQEWMTYSWECDPPSGMNYLSSSNVSNPVFTPPTNGNGSLEYTLAVTNTCGQFVSENLRVIYMNNPNETPIVVPSFVNDVFPVQMAIATSSFVESIVITAYDITETTVLDSWTLIAFEDFEPGGPLGWTIPGFHLACEGYVIKVVGKSMCSGIWSATSTYTVEPSSNEADIIQLSDVYWLDGTPPHDAINLYHTGFLSYTLRVYTGNNGTLIHHVVDVPITSNPVTIWDGSTNQHGWDHVAGNTYMAILELENCDGSITPIAEFWTILGGTGPSLSGRLADPELEEEIGEVNATYPFILYPNPTTGLLTLTHSQQLLSVEVYDPLGRQLLQTAPNATTTSIDLSGQPAGIYIICAGLEDGSVETHRVVLSPP